MCENNIIAFGMNGTEIMLAIGAIGPIIVVFVALVSYLNADLRNHKIDFIDIDLYNKEELKISVNTDGKGQE